ncbi:MAG: hypothetical protein DUD39_05390 [Coriobacteriaceae bacterium]|nr:MAG: hypothetical protein DUD39_05390 [Coriobacteriaceae bacterium]
MDTTSSILCDALWLLYLIDMILGHYVVAFTLISVMGVIYLLQASARSDTATEVSNATLNKKRFLGVLLIACSGIPVAVTALGPETERFVVSTMETDGFAFAITATVHPITLWIPQSSTMSDRAFMLGCERT